VDESAHKAESDTSDELASMTAIKGLADFITSDQTDELRRSELSRKVHGTLGASNCAIERALNELNTNEEGRSYLRADLAALRESLGYRKASTVECLAIEVVLFAYLRVALVEQEYAVIMKSSVTLNRGLYWERRLSMVHGRQLRALESLARVRRLMKPGVQVNIATNGGQQVVANAPVSGQ